MASIVDPVFESDVFKSAIFTGVVTDIIDQINLLSKRIYLRRGVTEYHPTDHITQEVQFHKAFDESLRVMDIPTIPQGGIFKGDGKYTSRLTIFSTDWHIVPFDEAGSLKVLGEQISEDGKSGAGIMDLVGMTNSIVVEYAPPDTEIITISTGSALTIEENAKLMALPDSTDNALLNTKLDSISLDVVDIKDGLLGSWEILSNQLIMYKSDGTTVLRTFDLLDQNSQPTENGVYKRIIN